MSEPNVPCPTERVNNRRVSERRAFIRYPCSQNSSCHSIRAKESDFWPATFCDISIGGLSLIVSRPFQEGDILALELQKPVEGSRGRLFVRVMHATPIVGGVWNLGCSFVNKLTDYELDALL